MLQVIPSEDSANLYEAFRQPNLTEIYEMTMTTNQHQTADKVRHQLMSMVEHLAFSI